MLDAYLDYSYYLVYIFYFEILEEKNHDFFDNWELMIHANDTGTETWSRTPKSMRLQRDETETRSLGVP